MKISQNVSLDELSDKNWSCQLKKLGHNVKSYKNLVYAQKRCVCSRGLTFNLILMKISQNVSLDELSDKNWSCQIKN